MVGALGAEVDRLETEIQQVMPSIRHIDLVSISNGSSHLRGIARLTRCCAPHAQRHLLCPAVQYCLSSRSAVLMEVTSPCRRPIGVGTTIDRSTRAFTVYPSTPSRQCHADANADACSVASYNHAP